MTADFEEQLNRFQPRRPSPKLKARIRAGLAAESREARSGSLFFEMWRWFVPAGAGILLVALGIAGKDASVTQPAPSWTYHEVPTEREAGLFYDEAGGAPLRVTRTSSIASYAWQDPKAGREIVTTFPREQIVISQLEIQ